MQEIILLLTEVKTTTAVVETMRLQEETQARLQEHVLVVVDFLDLDPRLLHLRKLVFLDPSHPTTAATTRLVVTVVLRTLTITSPSNRWISVPCSLLK